MGAPDSLTTDPRSLLSVTHLTTGFDQDGRFVPAVIDVSFSGEGVIVRVRLRRRRRVCSRCGQTGRLAIHGRRVKRWRHLDLGVNRCVIECELRRLWCRSCGAQFEAVPWARAGLIVYLARYWRIRGLSCAVRSPRIRFIWWASCQVRRIVSPIRPMP